MGFLAKASTLVTPARMRAAGGGAVSVGNGFHYMPEGWASRLNAAGIAITPELAMKLSHVHASVSIISDDFGTMPCSVYRDLGDDGRRKVRFSEAGLGNLAYRVRWQANRWQTAKAFWSTLAWQYLLRPACYAEIVYAAGSQSVIQELIPRHPDRVRQVTLPNGSLAFVLHGEPNGKPRGVTESEMFVVRNTSTDGLNALSRIDFGGETVATGLRLQQFTQVFYTKGITGSLLATYKGAEMSDEDEESLHRSITRYVDGAENAGGVMLVPEDVDVTALGVDPEKAQLIGLKDLSGRDIARMFKLQPYKLAIAGTSTYASQVQSSQEHVNTCMMPIVREFQDAIYLHLILAQDAYAKFNTAHLTMADLKTMLEALEVGVHARIWRPSEGRQMLDLPPDPELDRLSALDHRAGNQRDGQQNDGTSKSARRTDVRYTLVMHDNATRVLRRESAALEKLAKKYARAEQYEDWRRELRTFYEDHARFTADTMRVPDSVARAYCAGHGATVEAKGIGVMTDHWARLEAESLCELAIDPEAVERLVLPEGVPHAA